MTSHGVISKALNKGDLRYVQFPYDQFEQALAQFGVQPKTAALLIEMFQGLNDGVVVPLEPRSAENSTPTPIESFIRDVFAPAYHGKAVSA